MILLTKHQLTKKKLKIHYLGLGNCTLEFEVEVAAVVEVVAVVEEDNLEIDFCIFTSCNHSFLYIFTMKITEK